MGADAILVGVSSVFHFALGIGGREDAGFLLGGKLDDGDGSGVEFQSETSVGCSFVSSLLAFFQQLYIEAYL